MAFILKNDLSLAERDLNVIRKQWDAYQNYLQSIKEKISKEAFEFATASWHYDFSDHRCPHDSWVEYLNIVELSSGERRQMREIEIRVRLLGAYHDGYLDLIYKGVRSYSLNNDFCSEAVGHGDWFRDEIRLSEEGVVLHEIEFLVGTCWRIVCENIEWKWLPFENNQN